MLWLGTPKVTLKLLASWCVHKQTRGQAGIFFSKVDFDEKAVGFMVCSQPEKMPKVDSDDAEEKVSCSHWCYVSELLLVMIAIGGMVTGWAEWVGGSGVMSGPAIWNCYFLQPAKLSFTKFSPCNQGYIWPTWLYQINCVFDCLFWN